MTKYEQASERERERESVILNYNHPPMNKYAINFHTGTQTHNNRQLRNNNNNNKPRNNNKKCNSNAPPFPMHFSKKQ